VVVRHLVVLHMLSSRTGERSERVSGSIVPVR
jgi:hypothetical protein